MSYVKHNFQSKAKLFARQLNEMDEQIAANEQAATANSYVTPEMFGAKGDGATDDTEAIQAAFDAGKSVRFSRKTYVITAPVVMDKEQRVGLVYDGGGCTIKHTASNAFQMASAVVKDENDQVIPNGLTQCEIKNFSFKSSGMAYKGLFVIGGTAGAGSCYLQECAIRSCRFEKQKYGMYLGAYRLRVEHCYFDSCECGINDDCCNNAVFSNNFFISCGRGLNMNIPYFNTAINNTFHACDTGIYCCGLEDSGIMIGCTIIGNVFRGGTITPTRHLYVYSTQDVHVISNYFDHKASSAIQVFNADRVILAENRARGRVVLYFDEGKGKACYVDGGFFTSMTVGSVDADINLRNLVIGGALSTNTELYPRADRYINAENVRAASLGSGIAARLKNASILTTDNSNYTIRPFGEHFYRLTEDAENSTLKWTLLS